MGEKTTFTYNIGADKEDDVVATLRIDTGEMIITGNGAMKDWDRNDAPWEKGGNKNLIKSVKIADGITNIGNCAFCTCTSLQSIDIPDSVTSIGVATFQSCSSLETINIPNSVIKLGSRSFELCSSLSTLTLPNKLKEIERGTFCFCPFKSIDIPDSVEKIDSQAFYGTALETVTIGNGLNDINPTAFDNCNLLVKISVSENNQYYSADEKGILYNKAKTELVRCPANSGVTTEEIPDSVTSVGSCAFCSCKSLRSIDIPNGVTNIGDRAFEGCSSLEKATVLNEDTKFGERAFGYDSDGIKYDITMIGYTGSTTEKYANDNGLKFKEIGIETISIKENPDKTTYTEGEFFDPTGLEITATYTGGISVDIDYNNHKDQFKFTPSLQTALTKDMNQVTVEYGGVTATVAINVKPQSTITYNIGAVNEQDVVATLDLNTGVMTITGSGAMKNWDLPSYDTPWDKDGNGKVIKSVIIADGVTNIGSDAFCGCTNLQSIDIPDSVTSIGSCAFCSCKSLRSIDIPNGVTNIVDRAFSDCTNLEEFIVSDENLKYASVDGFLCNKSKTDLLLCPLGKSGNISVPSGIKNIRGSAFSWCDKIHSLYLPETVEALAGCAFNACTSLQSIYIPNSVTYIGGSAFSNCTSLQSIDIPNSVTCIGGSAFEGCKGLKSVTIGNSVTSIGGMAFRGCTGLTSIDIPDSVNDIGSYTFENCTSLQSIDIPDSVNDIGSYTFENCTSLQSIDIPNSVTSIGDWVFDGCTGLTSVTIGNSVTYIGSGAFRGCTGLTSIDIPDSVNDIGSYTFENCTSLQSIDIPNSVTSIEYRAFHGCTSLQSIYIPNSVTNIEFYTFRGCSSLQSIDIPNSVTSIGDRAFEGCSSLEKAIILNKDTKFGERAFGYDSDGIKYDITMIGYTGSTTEKYANDNGLKFKEIGIETISIKESPDKTAYTAGELFDPTGLVVTVKYNNGQSKDVIYSDTSKDRFTFVPSIDTALKTTDKSVEIDYLGAKVYQTITVREHVLTSIEVTKEPDKTKYCIADRIDLTGMVITATYSDGTEEIITDYKTAGFDSKTEGVKEITVSYENKYATFNITVEGVRWNFNDETGYLSGLTENISPSTMQDYYTTKGVDVAVTNKSGNIPKYIGTGCKVTYKDSETNEVKEYTAIVTGDVTGDGVINLTDAFGILDHINGVKKLTGEYEKAGLIISTKTISISDAFAVIDHINGTKKIEPKFL